MIPQIKEINFPEYATLSTATATLVDMGDKTVTAQVKIDGSIVPDFSYDWEIEFQGERYTQPLREPQASKSNDSISSVIDLTFYHKGIYDLKRHFFVSTAETEAGTIMADNYIVPLTLNLGKFVEVLNAVLKLYYGQTYSVDLNPEYEYDETDIKYIDINYTKIWDIFTQLYEWFGARWTLETHDAGDDICYYTFKVGYSSQEVSHIFKYGFEGGLLRFERQVQDAEIRNQMFGRGGSHNLPFRYFKKFDPNNSSWEADPDWIPELENIYFSELRGKSFRDYVRGWKAKHYGGQTYLPATDAYTKGFTDEKFDPIEYVEDKTSIERYGVIQGGLGNNEDIFPTIQKRDLGNGLGRADEIVDAETILVDEPTSNSDVVTNVMEISDSSIDSISSVNQPRKLQFVSSVYQVPSDHNGYFVNDYKLEAIESVGVTDNYFRWTSEGNSEIFETRQSTISHPLDSQVSWVKVIDVDTNEEIKDIVNIKSGTRFYVHAEIVVSNFFEEQSEEVKNYPSYGTTSTLVRTPKSSCSVIINFAWELDLTPFHGQILGNYTEGVNRISGSTTIPANGTARVTLETQEFTIDEGGATNVDIPIRIKSTDTSGSYTEKKTINAVNVETNEVIDPSNLPEGNYYIRVVIDITNLTEDSQDYTVELMPSYIYYPYDSAKWRPTFDIWIKDIWGSTRLADENDTSYAERVWRPILGDRQGDEAKVVFSSGLLSGHSDYEFPIVSFAYDNTKTLNGVPSHWRLTLAKSDADIEATGKWLPSIQIQASAGDHFLFIGIDMPHKYVLWAEEEVDKWLRDNMPSQVKPSFVVQADRVRLSELQKGEVQPLLNSLRIGNIIRTSDFRFIKGDYEALRLQSVTYTWDASTTILPNVEVVLSDNMGGGSNSIKNLLDDIKELRRSKLSIDEDIASLKGRVIVSTKNNRDTLKIAKATELRLNDIRKTVSVLQDNSKDVSIKLTSVESDITLLKEAGSSSTIDLTTIKKRVDVAENNITLLQSDESISGSVLNIVKTATGWYVIDGYLPLSADDINALILEEDENILNLIKEENN